MTAARYLKSQIKELITLNKGNNAPQLKSDNTLSLFSDDSNQSTVSSKKTNSAKKKILTLKPETAVKSIL